MRLDGALFAIEQRPVGGCIDMAIVFVREHFQKICQLLALFALPSLLLTWWLIDEAGWTFSQTVMLFLLISPYFSSALVAAAGRRMFGDEFSPIEGLKAVWSRFTLITVFNLVLRGLCCLIVLLLSISFGLLIIAFPILMVVSRYAFLTEILLLEGCPARKYESRTSDLMSGNFLNLFGRLLAVLGFSGLLVVSLFVLVDTASGTLFGFPIFVGRVTDFDYMEQEFETLFTRDPRIAVTILALCWAVYPLARLAWTFCYLDTRIRKEGWDIEIDFRVEARRLEELA